jgi:N,N'-diacetyllegionaminate synthase
MSETWLESLCPGAPCSVIVEIGQAHEGSLGMAHAYIDCAARHGADAIKFQTHIAAAESTPQEPWRTRFSTQDATRFDYWRRMEFSPSQWHELAAHAREVGLLFMSSPFSLEAVELLEDVGVAAWKVASGEISNDALLDAMAATGRPVLVSTGMSAWPEIDRALERVQSAGVKAGVFQCTSAYPCPPEKLGLNVLTEMRARYPGVGVGLSDHSGTIYAGVAAAALGLEMIEIHLAFHGEMFGPDVPSSVLPDQLDALVAGIRFAEAARSHPVNKAEVPEGVAELRQIFMKSAVLKRDMKAGETLASDDLAARKPGSGIPAREIPNLVGRRLARDVVGGVLLQSDDLEGSAS